MASTKGWITLHRQIQDHWVYSNSNYFHAWITILFEVNHKKIKPTLIKGKLIGCDRGESIKSLDTWVRTFGKGWTVQKVRTLFKLLESDGMIELKNEGVTTRLTVCNYDTYQTKQQPNNKKKALDITSLQHALNTHLTTNNNVNNENNEKQEESVCSVICDELCKMPNELRTAYMSWFQYKIEAKSMYKTPTGAKTFFGKNGKYSAGTIIESIKIAISREWIGLRPEDIEQGKQDKRVTL